MLESFITVLLIGFTAGFIFAMPIAGPISILITSNALKGNYKFCIRTALGASIVEFFYVVISVNGIALLFSLYSPLIPYLLIAGSVFLFFVGVKVFKTKITLEEIEKGEELIDGKKVDKQGGMRTGLIINLTNPSLFFGILTSSFLVLSFASSVGLNTGGLDILLEENVNSIQQITGTELKSLESIDSTYNLMQKNPDAEAERSSYTFTLSLVYGAALALGGFSWLFILTKLLIKYRNKIKVEFLNILFKSLGIILIGISFYLFYSALRILLS